MSTKEQAEGASLDAQKDAITAFASQNNLEIIKWFEEQETASKAGRPLFDAMRRELETGKAEGVVIHRIDRSSRNYTDWARIHDLAQKGIKVHFAADALDFDSLGGRLMADIQMVMSAHYSRNLSFEVKKGLYGRIKHGSYPFKAPLGYVDNGEGALKTICPKKGPLVRQAFDLYCSGEYSITSLTSEMAQRGLTGFRGRPVVRRNIETMLRNPFYIGKMLICDKLYDAAHEPLITAAQFTQIKRIKEDRRQKKETKHKLTYRGLLTCADCNKTLTGERQRGQIYYRCHTTGCRSGTIREDRLEAQIQSRLTRLEVSVHDKSYLRKRLQVWLTNTGTDEMSASIKLRIADAATRLDRLTDLLIDGTIDKDNYELRKRNTEFELQRLREEERARQSQQKSLDDLDQLLDMATTLGTVFASTTSIERRTLLKNCANALKVRQGKLRLSPAPWLQELNDLAKDDSLAPTPELLGTPDISTSEPIIPAF